MPRKIRCQVEAILDHGGRVYTLDLKPETSLPPFRPGQFLHLTVEDYEPASFWPESRVFSIASSPREQNRLRLCFAVKGRYTTKMEQALKVGGRVWIKLPYGEFVIDSASKAVLLAGGTGVSAFTAFLEALTPTSAQAVTLVYGARAPALFLFQPLICAQLASVAKLDALFFSETPDEDFTQRMAALPRAPRCYAGRIAMDTVWPQLESPADRVFYLSGPPSMLQTISTELRTRGITEEQIRTDAWG